MKEIVQEIEKLIEINGYNKESDNPYVVFLLNKNSNEIYHTTVYISEPEISDIFHLGCELSKSEEFTQDLMKIDKIVIFPFTELKKYVEENEK